MTAPTLYEVHTSIIRPALRLLPGRLDVPAARILLLAIGLQESRFLYRRQHGDGPARSFWQFERGTQLSKGGVWGVYLHPASRDMLQALCTARGCSCDPQRIWERIEIDDVLAAGVARLLLWTDAAPLPSVDDQAGAWRMYAERTWRPGKPHPETWPAYWRAARAEVLGADA
ncbi:MAG: hypothetical protein PGN26_14635 [Xylophilus ampelinus]